MGMIAGHTFAETPAGRACVGYSSIAGRPCGITWQHVRTCRAEDVETTYGIAHHGTPTRLEYEEIRREAEREEAAIWTAVLDACSSGSR